MMAIISIVAQPTSSRTPRGGLNSTIAVGRQTDARWENGCLWLTGCLDFSQPGDPHHPENTVKVPDWGAAPLGPT